MRLAQINTVYGRGSTGRIAALIHEATTRRRPDQAWSFYGRGPKSDDSSVIRVGTRSEQLLQGVETRLLDRHGMGSLLATKALIDALDSRRPDIVQLHNLHGYYLNYPTLIRYLRERQLPVVLTLHDAWTFTGHCTYFDWVGCTRWETGCHTCPQKAEYPTSRWRDRSKLNFEQKRELLADWEELMIVAPSQWMAGLAEQSFFQRPARVIRNDPDLSLFTPVDSGWRQLHALEDKFVILAVASVWERRKGIDHVRQLASMLRPDEELVVVGQLQPHTELPEQCRHVPRTADADTLAAIYSSADVYINPTMEDNYPTTNLEAMACGTPCITFETGGSPETLRRGLGWVTSSRDAGGLRSSIDALREAPVCAVYDGSTVPMATEYLRLYDELLSAV